VPPPRQNKPWSTSCNPRELISAGLWKSARTNNTKQHFVAPTSSPRTRRNWPERECTKFVPPPSCGSSLILAVQGRARYRSSYPPANENVPRTAPPVHPPTIQREHTRRTPAPIVVPAFPNFRHSPRGTSAPHAVPLPTRRTWSPPAAFDTLTRRPTLPPASEHTRFSATIYYRTTKKRSRNIRQTQSAPNAPGRPNLPDQTATTNHRAARDVITTPPGLCPALRPGPIGPKHLTWPDRPR